MYFLSLFWVLFTHPLLDSSGKMQSNEGGKHFTGRIKESQSFTHNTVKTYNKVTIQFLLFLCFYIYIDYFSMSVLICLTFFFSLYCWSFQSHGRSGFMKNAVYLPVSFSDPPCFSHDVHWCVFVPPTPICCESLFCPYPPSFTFTGACPFLVSAWLHLLTPPSLITCQNQWLITLPNLYFIHFPNTSGTVWAYTVQRLCWHNSFICNKSMQHPGQALPLVDVCLSFLSRKT